MIEAMQTAIAGLRVSVQRLGVAAENIANVRSSGGLELYDGYVPCNQPERAVLLMPQSDGSTIRCAPSDPSANADGMMAMPKVSLPAQFVELSTAQRSYEANVAILETTSEMMKTLVDREF